MSSGTQVELDWAGMDAAPGAAAPPSTLGAIVAEAKPGAYLTDEEILGIDPPSPKGGYGGQAPSNATTERAESRDTAEINNSRSAGRGNTAPKGEAGWGGGSRRWGAAAAVR